MCVICRTTMKINLIDQIDENINQEHEKSYFSCNSSKLNRFLMISFIKNCPFFRYLDVKMMTSAKFGAKFLKNNYMKIFSDKC